MCWQVSLEVKVICLPAQEDPASYLTKGADLAPLINGAKDIFLFFIEKLGQDFAGKPLSEKLKITRKLLTTIQNLDDAITQDILLKRAADMLEIPFESLQKELNKQKEKTSASSQQAEKNIPIHPQQPQHSEPAEIPHDARLKKKLFYSIMHNITLFNNDNQEYLIEYLPNSIKYHSRKTQGT